MSTLFSAEKNFNDVGAIFKRLFGTLYYVIYDKHYRYMYFSNKRCLTIYTHKQ